MQRNYSEPVYFAPEATNYKDEYLQLKQEIFHLKQAIAELRVEIGDMRKTKALRTGLVVDNFFVLCVLVGCMLGMFVSVCMQSMK